MKATNLTETMPLKDIQAIESALKALRLKMTFVITLTAQERSPLPNPSEKRLAQLDGTLAAAKENDGLLPKQFDLARFERDVRLVQALAKCLFSLTHMASDMRDTLRTVASDPLKASMEVYDHVKTASKRTPLLKPLARRLSGRTPRPPRATAAPPPTETAPPPPPPPPEQKAA